MDYWKICIQTQLQRHFLMSMSSSVKMCAIPCVAAKNMMTSIAILRNDHGF